MRTSLPLFLVSALLFVFGVGFTVVGARDARRSATTAAAPVAPPVASVKQLMSAIVSPTSTAIYDSVQTISDEKGVREVVPATPEEWDALGAQAAALAEAGVLLTTGNRAVDQGDWVKFSQSMIDGSKQAMAAATAKDKNKILDAGGTINVACDNCHNRYRRQ